jgi:hypothetical protein
MRDGRDEVVLEAVELDQIPVLFLDERPRLALTRQELLALGLEPAALGDVADDAGDPDNLTVVVSERRERDLHVDEAAVLALPLHLVRVHAVLFEHLLEVVLERVAVSRWHDAGDAGPDHLLGRVAEQVLGAGVPGSDRAVETCGNDGVAGRLDDSREREQALMTPLPLLGKAQSKEDGDGGQDQDAAGEGKALERGVGDEPGGDANCPSKRVRATLDRRRSPSPFPLA